MSTSAETKGRPLPFEIHAAFLQFFTLAMGTPDEVAQISVELNAFSCLQIAVYPGGYDAGKDKALRESIYFHDGTKVSAVIDNCNEVMKKINAMLAEGRQVKIRHLKGQAEALLKQVADMESTLLATS